MKDFIKNIFKKRYTPNSETISSLVVTKYLIYLSNKKGKKLNTTQIQKLLYIIYGYFIVNRDYQFIDESPILWPYGPVFFRSREFCLTSIRFNLEDNDILRMKNDIYLTDIINKIIDKYSKFSAVELSTWIQNTEPIIKTKNKLFFRWNSKIDNKYIKEYFEKFTII